MWITLVSYSSYFIGCVIFFFLGTFFEYKRMYDYMEKSYSEKRLLPLIQKHLDLNEKENQNENTEMFHVEMLKNALLSYALNIIKINDPNFKPFSDFSMDYKNFDGTSLPMFSGSSITNACFTYIRDCKEEIYDYLPLEKEKQNAIRKYLMKNLNTEEKIIEFFDKFVEISNKNKNVINLNTKDEIDTFLSTYKDESNKKMNNEPISHSIL